MAKKITHKVWALLINGAYSSYHDGAAILRVEDGFFMMKKPSDHTHALAICATDHVRLNEHWQGFIKGAQLPR